MQEEPLAPKTPKHEPNEAGHSGPAAHSRSAFWKKRSLWVIVGVIVLAIVVALIVMLAREGDDAKNADGRSYDTNSGSEGAFAREYLEGCKDRSVSFTHAPVPMDQMGYIEPMGKTNDGHVTPTDHVYVSPNDQRAADNTFDVVMPADGTVTAISAMPAQYIGDGDQQVAPEDHRLVVAHNCQYVSIFIHIHKLSDALVAALGGKLEPNTSKKISVELKAGDKLGKIGGNPVDWSLMDAKQTLSGFITPSLYVGESWKIHVIDPISVYSGSMKDQMIAKSLRTTAPYGGKIDYDKKGALVGNWFREGTNGYAGADQSRYWDGHLSVAPDYIDPTGTIVSVGNWQGKAKQFAASANSPDPAKVTEQSGALKYELLSNGYTLANGQAWSGGSPAKGMKLTKTGQAQGVMLVQVMKGEKLKMELFPGKTAEQVSGFTSAASMYER